MNKNKYEVLGLTREASDTDIGKKFRELSLLYHPDKTWRDPEGIRQEKQKKFQDISNAYETLSDPDERKEYDLTLPRSYSSQERHTSTASTYSQPNASNANAQGPSYRDGFSGGGAREPWKNTQYRQQYGFYGGDQDVEFQEWLKKISKPKSQDSKSQGSSSEARGASDYFNPRSQDSGSQKSSRASGSSTFDTFGAKSQDSEAKAQYNAKKSDSQPNADKFYDVLKSWAQGATDSEEDREAAVAWFKCVFEEGGTDLGINVKLDHLTRCV